MRAVSLFSGCGGMDIGAERAGARVIYANDVDPDSGQSLKAYMPHTDFVLGDVRSIASFPDADLVIGGYPCQSFSMGGNRDPEKDERTHLYQEFGRCLNQVSPKYFVAENVSGLKKLQNGKFLEEQTKLFESIGKTGYRLSIAVLNARDYGVPQVRKRVFIVGVRKDLGTAYCFPQPTHGEGCDDEGKPLVPYASHGDAIAHLPLWPEGEFYARPHDPEGHWSWYYMSRNRKADWDGPSFTIVANWRHITLHPASPVMKLTWSNLADGWKQRWDFSDEYEHVGTDASRQRLETPRRLSWRECALIQTFPPDFTLTGSTESRFRQVGNAVPPVLAEAIIRPICDGSGLLDPDAVRRQSEPKRRSKVVTLGPTLWD